MRENALQNPDWALGRNGGLRRLMLARASLRSMHDFCFLVFCADALSLETGCFAKAADMHGLCRFVDQLQERLGRCLQGCGLPWYAPATMINPALRGWVGCLFFIAASRWRAQPGRSKDTNFIACAKHTQKCYVFWCIATKNVAYGFVVFCRPKTDLILVCVFF